jgi:hypothetical protein
MYQVNQIDVGGNKNSLKLFKSSAFSFVPPNILTQWQAEKPDDKGIIETFRPGYSLADVHARLDFQATELSGSLGYDWMQSIAGEKGLSLCQSANLFTWHTHPDGNPQFSGWDWLVFILSQSYLSAVFAQKSTMLYRKNNSGRWLSLRKELVLHFYEKGLLYVRFCRKMQHLLDRTDWESLPSSTVGFMLNISTYKFE